VPLQAILATSAPHLPSALGFLGGARPGDLLGFPLEARILVASTLGASFASARTARIDPRAPARCFASVRRSNLDAALLPSASGASAELRVLLVEGPAHVAAFTSTPALNALVGLDAALARLALWTLAILRAPWLRYLVRAALRLRASPCLLAAITLLAGLVEAIHIVHLGLRQPTLGLLAHLSLRACVPLQAILATSATALPSALGFRGGARPRDALGTRLEARIVLASTFWASLARVPTTPFKPRFLLMVSLALARIAHGPTSIFLGISSWAVLHGGQALTAILLGACVFQTIYVEEVGFANQP